MSQTATQIRDRAGNDLGLLPLGRDLQAQDATRITQGYSEVYAQLKKEGLAIWASDGSVPDEVAPYVVLLVCLNCMETYGIPDARAKRIYTKAGENGYLALKKIREHVKPDFVSQDEAKDY